MGKKQYQSQGKYAKTSNQAKKKRTRKPEGQLNSFSASSQEDSTGDAPASTVRVAPIAQIRQAQAVVASHAYVASDLIYTGIIAVLAFIILIVLYFVL